MKMKLTLLGTIILVASILLITFFAVAQQNLAHKMRVSGKATVNPVSRQGPMQITGGSVISRNLPAFASSGYYPASNANDDSYDTTWRSQSTPSWLTYNLSNVPASERAKVLVVWYNETNNYDHTLINYHAYNIPQDYTIDVNPDRGRGSPPSGGWKTVVTVKGNHYHSREHLIDMVGDNWLRINITKVDGSLDNYDASINMDVYNASYGTSDSWMFFGDSITAGSMGHLTIGTVKAFAQLITTKEPTYFPVQESGGIGYLTSADGAKYMQTWLQLFPGKYVVLSYGSNDASNCVDANNFYNNYTTMIQAVLSAGKIPVIPYIPWARTANVQRCGPMLNAKIAILYNEFPQIIKGPDLWTFFQSNQSLISKDNIHPTDVGFGVYRQLWANTMLAAVYKR